MIQVEINVTHRDKEQPQVKKSFTSLETGYTGWNSAVRDAVGFALNAKEYRADIYMTNGAAIVKAITIEVP